MSEPRFIHSGLYQDSAMAVNLQRIDDLGFAEVGGRCRHYGRCLDLVGLAEPLSTCSPAFRWAAGVVCCSHVVGG